ncbi:MAG: hypothetical protein NUW09_05965 [Deltaproteobacteria bacterium]|nr:hypothetical protein [Deltaproteobacteria bacterium]
MKQVTIEFTKEEYYKLLIYAILKDDDMRVDVVCRDLVLYGLKDFDHESIDILPKLRKLNHSLRRLNQHLDEYENRKKDTGQDTGSGAG